CSKGKADEKHSKRVLFSDHVMNDDGARNTAGVDISKESKCEQVQTDIAQFQIDEIVLRLAALQ
ncbi:hypothetical protein DICVIV_14229, partial [Dictyocaulus viviparus]